MSTCDAQAIRYVGACHPPHTREAIRYVVACHPLHSTVPYMQDQNQRGDPQLLLNLLDDFLMWLMNFH